jgi:polysaccharide deacetylase family protein (PEP-CTERM system associated)
VSRSSIARRSHAPAPSPPLARQDGCLRTVLSFDVEEHHRIEAASGLAIPPGLRAHYASRLEPSTRWLLDQLASSEIRATFFVVGQLARSHARLVRAVADAGHEVASHSWDHRLVRHHTPASFREDLRRSRGALEQAAGRPVLGYRAPTFSIGVDNAWALDVLAEEGFAYDSSIFPVRHDRYGVPGAPRAPFRARGLAHEILELPPATLRVLGMNLPVGGGGYFRLLPRFLLRWALAQVRAHLSPAVAMLYFHPWEFDLEQERLPLGRVSAFRTYVGIGRSRERLVRLLAGRRFLRAVDVARQLSHAWGSLPTCVLAADGEPTSDATDKVGACAAHGRRPLPRLADNTA